MNIETELRTALADEAAFANDLHDPYPTFIQREAKRRRTRRLRVATAVATVVALAAAAVGLQAFGSRNQPRCPVPPRPDFSTLRIWEPSDWSWPTYRPASGPPSTGERSRVPSTSGSPGPAGLPRSG